MTTTSEPQPVVANRKRFRVSLKTLLISLLAIGAGTGLLGRLFLTHPQIALGIVFGLSTLVPFLLAIGTICVLGIRGKRAGLILWAGCLFLMPAVGFVVMYFGQRTVGVSRGDLAVLNTQLLIEERLAKQVDEPWVWNELGRRIKSKSLTAEQADEAVGVFIAHMKKTKPAGWDAPLHWQDDFLEAATGAGLVSDPVLYDLHDAYFGPKPVIRPLPRVREGSSGVEITVRYGTTWARNSGLPLMLVWDVQRVLLNGQPVEIKNGRRQSETWTGRLENDLAVGEATLSLEVEAAYIDQKRLVGLSAYDLPVSNWPKVRKRWKQTVSAPLRIYSAEEPIVALSTDPESDPQRANAILIKRFVAQTDPQGGTRLILLFEFTAGLSIPLSCDVSVKAGDQVYPMGRQWIVKTKDRTSSGGGTLRQRIESLDPGIGVCDIILTPNPKHIEQRPEVNEIWGKTITFRNVPLERLDLEVEQEPDSP